MNRLTLRLVIPVIMLAFTAACGASSSSQRTVSSTSPSIAATTATASGSPAASATTSASATAAATASGLSCRLPIVTFPNQTTEAGFISFPAGTYARDPGGNISSKAYGLAYDRVYGRWLPVDWRLVSDDGTHYVYEDYSDTVPSPGSYSTIHLVTVATGGDRVLTRSGQYTIMDYTGGGVYLTQWVGGHDGPGPQIGWVLNPSTGGISGLSGGQKYGYSIGAGAGWRGDYNTADPTVHNGMTGFNRLIRVDLTTGAEATWLYVQGSDGVQLLGFDRSGHPIVSSSTNQVQTIYLLTDATHRTQLFTTPLFLYQMIADTHGIWFSDGAATYLYTAGSGIQKMATVGGNFAGGCH